MSALWFAVAGAGLGLTVTLPAVRWMARGGHRLPDERELRPPPLRWTIPLGIAAPALVGAAWAGRPALAVLYCLAAALLIVLATIDADVHRLPDRWTKPAWVIVPPALLVLTLAENTGLSPWWRALASGVGLGVFYLVLVLLGGGNGMGLGDAKLAPTLGALLGFLSVEHVLAATLVTVVTGGVHALVQVLLRRRDRKSHMAFGPFMVAGTVLVIGAPALTLLR